MDNMPPKSLYELQQAFSDALHYQPSTVSECICPGAFPAEQLLQIYRNNFIISLSEVLEAAYPCTLAVVGEECFAQLTRLHVLALPLKQGDVSHYGEHLANTIEQHPSLVEAVPYLADLARLEWLIDQISQLTPYSPNFPFHQLSHITENNIGQLQFNVAEPTGCTDSLYPVASLWQMIKTEQVDAIDLNQPESAIIQLRTTGIVVVKCPPDATSLLRLCQQHQPLSNATAPMLSQLNELIQQQIFTHIDGLPKGI
ncbi:DNA-binding domain-containing protein [Photobacterium nomapromontoriensis]|uniref:HvfC/BufC N-terminal domain-containing protein n=1 Tax=Photobacterium nomapromontoriensis TaxID=2910237 RepID=UPI003D0B0260